MLMNARVFSTGRQATRLTTPEIASERLIFVAIRRQLAVADKSRLCSSYMSNSFVKASIDLTTDRPDAVFPDDGDFLERAAALRAQAGKALTPEQRLQYLRRAQLYEDMARGSTAP